MKNLNLLFIALIILSSCAPDKNCVSPPCSTVDINDALKLQLQFCVDENNNTCFQKEELNQVVVITKSIESNEIVGIDSIFHLANFDNAVTFGSKGILFNDKQDHNNSISYYYEISIPATGQQYQLNNIEIVNINRDKLCECAAYQIVRFAIDGKTYEVNSANTILQIHKSVSLNN